MGMSFNPASAAAAMASARELYALREMVEQDRNDLLIQGEIIMKISDLLIAQQAFAGNSHEENFKLRFTAISSVTEITPARLEKVKSLQADMLSLMQHGFSKSCQCSKCVNLQASFSLPVIEKSISDLEQKISEQTQKYDSLQKEYESFQASVVALKPSAKKRLRHPYLSALKKWFFGVVLILTLSIASFFLLGGAIADNSVPEAKSTYDGNRYVYEVIKMAPGEYELKYGVCCTGQIYDTIYNKYDVIFSFITPTLVLMGLFTIFVIATAKGTRRSMTLPNGIKWYEINFKHFDSKTGESEYIQGKLQDIQTQISSSSNSLSAKRVELQTANEKASNRQ